MELFEALLAQEQVSIERFVRFRIDSPADAEDILQETYLTAYQKFSQLRNPDAFKAWVLSIARNKCTDYFRQKALRQETSFEALAESADSRYGASDSASVRETFDTLREKDRQILHFFFWEELTQEEIAKKLGIPIGTVKSRLFTAKHNFKKQYPYIFTAKEGAASMKKFPDFLPEYTIAASAEPPFALRWEELAGWFLIPRLGEKCSWGIYDIPSRKCSNLYHLQVTGKARVHGIEGVELTAEEDSRFGKQDSIRRSFVAQLTDTHCRYLAVARTEEGVRNYITFLDGLEFMLNWGYGADNCGKEITRAQKGKMQTFFWTLSEDTRSPLAARPMRPYASWTLSAPAAMSLQSSFWTEAAGQSCGAGSIGTTGPWTAMAHPGPSSCPTMTACSSTAPPMCTGTTA